MTSLKPKILVITEGNLEEIFFQKFALLFDLKFCIVTINCNMYLIYKYILENDPDFSHILNIKDIVLEISRDKNDSDRISDENILQDKYAYTYLFYDFDIHHPINDGIEHNAKEIFNFNISKISKMVDYFYDESDDTIGKLFINYPMMESFKDLDSFDDENYYTKSINVTDSCNYKSIVCKSKLGAITCDELGYDDYKSLIKLNLKKSSKLLNITNINNSNFLDVINTRKIFDFQKFNVINYNKISILNTSILFYVEYKKDFYNEWKSELS